MKIPENCKLTAAHTGDGWELAVVDSKQNLMALLDWPNAWPEIIGCEKLEEFGFEIA